MSFIILESALNTPLSIAINQGHAGMYFENLCPDTPLKLRFCKEGEQGAVIDRLGGISPREHYDWLVVKPSTFFYGVDDPQDAPLIANKKIERLAQLESFRTQFRDVITSEADGSAPKGEWESNVGNSFIRDTYLFHVKTTREDDLKILKFFNESPNISAFNLFTKNCSNLPEDLFKLLYPDRFEISKIPNLAMATPKGLAMDIVHYARSHPEINLTITKIAQTPTTYRRSIDNYFPLENSYKSLWTGLIAGFQPRPYALVGSGAMHMLSYITVGAILFHEVLMRFSIPDVYKKYLDQPTLAIVNELESLRDEQDQIRAEINSLRAHGDDRKLSTAMNREVEINQNLAALKRKLTTQQSKVLGTKEDWEAYSSKYTSLVQEFLKRSDLPQEVRNLFQKADDPGAVARAILKYFDQKGEYTIKNGAVQVAIPIQGEAQARESIVSATKVLSGDELLGSLALLASTGFRLDASKKNLDTLESFKGYWDLLILSLSRSR